MPYELNVSQTYAGSRILIAAGLPAERTVEDFRAMTFVGGTCALHTFPKISRTPAAVREPLVCRATNTTIKGSKAWDDLVFKLSEKPSDEAQAIYRAHEENDEVCTIQLIRPGKLNGFFIPVQIAMYSFDDGGGQDDIIAGSVTAYIQDDPMVNPYVPPAEGAGEGDVDPGT